MIDRFDAKQGYYTYPEAKDANPLKLMLNQGSTYDNDVNVRADVYVIKLGLRIPALACNYADFSNNVKIAEQEFISN